MSRKFNALLGLGALAFASSAFAQCPSSPVPPWTAAPTFQGSVAIAAGGYDGTSCRMNSTINAGGSGAATAVVQDDTPSAEPRYRAQFIVNADSLTNQGFLAGANIFVANATSFGGVNQAVRLSMFGAGGGNRSLGIFTVASGSPGNVTSTVAPLAAGENRIEIDWQAGATGSLRVWINNPNEGSPTVTLPNLNNAGWVGIDQIFLGLSAPTPQFISAHGGTAVGFDEFDSRRQTFIGN